MLIIVWPHATHLLCLPLLDRQLMGSHPVSVGPLVSLAGTIDLQVTWTVHIVGPGDWAAGQDCYLIT
jgi:hypothetical protein